MTRKVGKKTGGGFNEENVVNQSDSSKISRKMRTENFSLGLVSRRLLKRTALVELER